jgi:rubrerythrin
VEDIKKKMEELDRWHTVTIKENIKNPFANTSTSICHNCDHKDEYIEELESEVDEYQAIGTIEEFKVLKEKAEPKEMDGYYCPICRHYFEDTDAYNCCPVCGQKMKSILE